MKLRFNLPPYIFSPAAQPPDAPDEREQRAPVGRPPRRARDDETGALEDVQQPDEWEGRRRRRRRERRAHPAAGQPAQSARPALGAAGATRGPGGAGGAAGGGGRAGGEEPQPAAGLREEEGLGEAGRGRD